MHRNRIQSNSESISVNSKITNDRALRSVIALHFQRILELGVLVSAWTGFLLTILSKAAFADVSASPTAPPGAAALQDLLNWTLYGGAIACTATAMYGFAKMGISHSQQSFQGANHGKSIAILGLLGALGLGLTPTIVNALTAIH